MAPPLHYSVIRRESGLKSKSVLFIILLFSMQALAGNDVASVVPPEEDTNPYDISVAKETPLIAKALADCRAQLEESMQEEAHRDHFERFQVELGDTEASRFLIPDDKPGVVTFTAYFSRYYRNDGGLSDMKGLVYIDVDNRGKNNKVCSINHIAPGSAAGPNRSASGGI